MKSQKIKILVLTILIVSLGFLRGYFFHNINWIYLTLVNGRMNGARDEFHFLLEWSLNQINFLKFGLTAFFILTFFSLTYLIVKGYFKNDSFNKIVILCFATIVGLAGILLIIGKSFGIYKELYGMIRTLMGIVQSFIPLMILVLLFRFFPSRN